MFGTSDILHLTLVDIYCSYTCAKYQMIYPDLQTLVNNVTLHKRNLFWMFKELSTSFPAFNSLLYNMMIAV